MIKVLAEQYTVHLPWHYVIICLEWQQPDSPAVICYEIINYRYIIDSREVAEIVEKQHKNLLADITRYSKELTKLNFQLSDFFIESSYNVEGQSNIPPSDFLTESTYQDSQNKTMPCYRVITDVSKVNRKQLVKFANPKVAKYNFNSGW